MSLCGVVSRTEPFRLCVVWSAGQSLSVSLCGVVSRTEPFRASVCGVVNRKEAVSVWCGQPDRAFLCLCVVWSAGQRLCHCVVWSAGQSLSVSLCGVVSRTEPFPHSEHRFPAPSSKKDVVNQCLEFEPFRVCVVWSAGQSLSVSLCGVVSRTEPFCVSLWCGQPDRAFLCLSVVWSAGQSLSVSLCGVVSRTEPFCVSLWCGQPDRAFLCLSVVWSAGQSLSVSLCGVVSRTEPFCVSLWCGQPDRAFLCLSVVWSAVGLQGGELSVDTDQVVCGHLPAILMARSSQILVSPSRQNLH